MLHYTHDAPYLFYSIKQKSNLHDVIHVYYMSCYTGAVSKNGMGILINLRIKPALNSVIWSPNTLSKIEVKKL